MAPNENTPTDAAKAKPQTAPTQVAPEKPKKSKKDDSRGKLVTRFGVKMWIKG